MQPPPTRTRWAQTASPATASSSKPPGPRRTIPGHGGRTSASSRHASPSRSPPATLTSFIAIKRDDLHSPYDYLEIAELLADTARSDEAIDWARRGLEQYADRWHQTPKLRDWLAELLGREERADEVTALYWDAFVRHPTLGTYRQLVDHAVDATAASEEAIAQLQAVVGSPVGSTGHRYPADPLIEILDHEGRHDEAWTLYLEYGCDRDLALQLAKRREADHPLDAITVYERDVEQHIDRKNKTGYRAAVRQLARIRKLAAQAGQPEVATAIIERIRTEHRQKRNLMSLLDDAEPNFA